MALAGNVKLIDSLPLYELPSSVGGLVNSIPKLSVLHSNRHVKLNIPPFVAFYKDSNFKTD